MVNKAFISPSSCKKQINKQNSYLLLAFLQSGSAPELDMHESKHFLPGQFVHSAYIIGKNYNLFALIAKQAGKAYLNLYKFIWYFLTMYKYCIFQCSYKHGSLLFSTI